MPIAVGKSYALTTGRMNISRGTAFVLNKYDEEVMKFKLYSWDVLPVCREERCPAAQHCQYLTGKLLPEKCWVVGKYVKHTTDVIFANIGDKMTEAQMFRVGVNLIPLYRNLARMKIEEAGLISPLVRVKKQDVPHKVYKEIREHIKAIDALWKSIGIEHLDIKYNLPPGVTFEKEEGDEELSYYDRLEAEVQKDGMKDVTPKKKEKKGPGRPKTRNPKLKLRKSIYRRAQYS